MGRREADRPRGELRICEEQGKHRHSSLYWAKVAAREIHRTMNRNGELATNLYVYRCPSCGSLHLTRKAVHYGEPQQLILEAAPVALQLWAMGRENGPQIDAQEQP